VLVEGGESVLDSFFAAGLVDRVMVFVCPRILGATGAQGPVMGDGRTLAEALAVRDATFSQTGPDLVIEGRVGEF
jgi:diaminohydroxyphosphoribosylaminopyrimidine deaminase/5-amino-6-(5-phosphoribosylamino)uracil reductase